MTYSLVFYGVLINPVIHHRAYKYHLGHGCQSRVLWHAVLSKKHFFPRGNNLNEQFEYQAKAIKSKCRVEWTGVALVSVISRAEIGLSSRTIRACIAGSTSGLDPDLDEPNKLSIGKSDGLVSQLMWYFSGTEAIHQTYSYPYRRGSYPIGMGGFDRPRGKAIEQITCLEISSSSLSRDSVSDSLTSERQFHEVLFLEPAPGANEGYYRIGVGIIFAQSNAFENALSNEILVL
jgi:hypothetical protein